MNAPISSYAVMDTFVEYLSNAQVQFPKLKWIVVTCHSVGEQLVY